MEFEIYKVELSYGSVGKTDLKQGDAMKTEKARVIEKFLTSVNGRSLNRKVKRAFGGNRISLAINYVNRHCARTENRYFRYADI